MRQYVMGFATNAASSRVPEVLLALKTGKDPSGAGWNGVGGKVEPGESPMQAMNREWGEETGRPQPHGGWKPAGSFGDERGGDWVVHLFAADYLPSRIGGGDIPTAVFRLQDCLDGSVEMCRSARLALFMAAVDRDCERHVDTGY